MGDAIWEGRLTGKIFIVLLASSTPRRRILLGKLTCCVERIGIELVTFVRPLASIIKYPFSLSWPEETGKFKMDELGSENDSMELISIWGENLGLGISAELPALICNCPIDAISAYFAPLERSISSNPLGEVNPGLLSVKNPMFFDSPDNDRPRSGSEVLMLGDSGLNGEGEGVGV